jgi:hypothetical protein
MILVAQDLAHGVGLDVIYHASRFPISSVARRAVILPHSLHIVKCMYHAASHLSFLQAGVPFRQVFVLS